MYYKTKLSTLDDLEKDLNLIKKESYWKDPVVSVFQTSIDKIVICYKD